MEILGEGVSNDKEMIKSSSTRKVEDKVTGGRRRRSREAGH